MQSHHQQGRRNICAGTSRRHGTHHHGIDQIVITGQPNWRRRRRGHEGCTQSKCAFGMCRIQSRFYILYELEYYTALNWAGKRLLQEISNTSIALWPLVLERASKYERMDRVANILYYLLRGGPALLYRWSEEWTFSLYPDSKRQQYDWMDLWEDAIQLFIMPRPAEGEHGV
jgi:hypothetical protein